MMYFALAVIGIGAFLLLCNLLWSSKLNNKNTRIIALTSLALVCVLGAFVFMQRMPWPIAATTMLVPFLRVLGRLVQTAMTFLIFRHLTRFRPAGFTFRSAQPKHTDSETQTNELAMKLDHQTGTMTGTVLTGEFEGQDLESLSDDQLREVYTSLQEEESKRLLEAYITRHRPHLNETSTDNNDQTDGEEMSVKRAADILGIDVSAPKGDIIAAHRRLMDKLHPDKGGSSYLAAELNEAKQVMLGALG